ncbi:MAG: nuclear transport factor 2 family protein [Burkholderiaceae bacterium]|nr:nuclear transport factor 2 family protein [Burkholderiaceae bacterium]
MSVAERFYDAFALGDWHTMGMTYAQHATFSDPVFPLLSAEEVRAMWHMLLARAQDFSLSYNVVAENEDGARVVWVAHYTFSQTGRPVTNRVVTEMRFAAGRIVKQVDRFGLWRWSRQALGLPGLLLGWTPMMRDKVQNQAAAGLRKFVHQERQRGR